MAPELHQLSYAAEKFNQAVYSLAIGPERINDRLVSAYGYVLRLTPDHIPDRLRGRVRDLTNSLTREKAKGDEGTLQATLRVISEDEAMDAAREIYELASEVEDEFKEQRAGRPASRQV